MKKLYISKPSKIGSTWYVQVRENISPLSKVIETMEFSSRHAAWNAYWKARKQEGTAL